MIILIEKIIVFGILGSGIYISRPVPVNFSESYISWCTSEAGVCIFANCTTLSITRSCFSCNHATKYASSVLSYADMMFNTSTIFRCSPNEPGADDNINIESSTTNIIDVNFSNNYDSGASGYQISKAILIVLSRILHMNSFDNPAKSTVSTVFEYIRLNRPLVVIDCVFSNNTEIYIMPFNEATHSVGLKRCVFSQNHIRNALFGIYLGNIPSISLDDVSILDGTPLEPIPAIGNRRELFLIFTLALEQQNVLAFSTIDSMNL